jgi:hypothetical protein
MEGKPIKQCCCKHGAKIDILSEKWKVKSEKSVLSVIQMEDT